MRELFLQCPIEESGLYSWEMNQMAAWLNTLGLCLGMWGVVMVFIWGFPQPSFEEGEPLGLESQNLLEDERTVEQRNEDTKRKKRFYKIMSQIGLGCIFGGFLLQLIAQWV
jgi:hypothetical protein